MALGSSRNSITKKNAAETRKWAPFGRYRSTIIMRVRVCNNVTGGRVR